MASFLVAETVPGVPLHGQEGWIKVTTNARLWLHQEKGIAVFYMADKEAERIKFETELLRISALFALAIGGGSISLFLGEPTFPRLILAVGGLSVTLCLAVAGWRQRTRIQQLVEEIKEAP